MKNETSHEADILKELGHRGDRPLSLLDLIDLKTLDLELAAWLVSHVSRGASFIIGARPGNVGKTTTMRALLDFVPGDLPFAIALSGKVAGIDGSPRCLISHELSDHDVPNYLWDQDLRDFFALSERGHVLVGNMHTDFLDETQSQICDGNDIPETHFRAVDLFIFIRIEGDSSSTWRVIDSIHYSDGTAAHEPVYTFTNGLSTAAPRDAADEKLCRTFLEEILSSPERTTEEVRRSFLDWEERRKDG